MFKASGLGSRAWRSEFWDSVYRIVTSLHVRQHFFSQAAGLFDGVSVFWGDIGIPIVWHRAVRGYMMNRQGDH